MGGIGPTEVVVVALMALLLFGMPLLTFVAGYLVGQHRAKAASPPPSAASPPPAGPVEEPASPEPVAPPVWPMPPTVPPSPPDEGLRRDR